MPEIKCNCEDYCLFVCLFRCWDLRLETKSLDSKYTDAVLCFEG